MSLLTKLLNKLYGNKPTVSDVLIFNDLTGVDFIIQTPRNKGKTLAEAKRLKFGNELSQQGEGKENYLPAKYKKPKTKGGN